VPVLAPATRLHCPLCPRSFDDDAGVRVHLTETHQLYDVLRAIPPVIDLSDAPAPKPSARRLEFEPEPDIWTLLGHDEDDTPDDAPPRNNTGNRLGAYLAVVAGIILILAAFLPH
jgi:hypothetical protein